MESQSRNKSSVSVKFIMNEMLLESDDVKKK